MAYTVNFGLMNKKVNSTKRDFAVNFSASCSLKIPSDVYAPTFLVHGEFPPTNNYFHVPAFGRYYWITNIVFNSGNWEVSGKCDALATFRDEIGGQVQYIERSSHSRSNYVNDVYAVAKTMPTIRYKADNIGLSATGCYILEAAGKSGNKFYAIDEASFRVLSQKIFSSGFLQDSFDVWQAITQDFYNEVLNPSQFIISCKWIPADFATVAAQGNAENISLGLSYTGATGYALSPSATTFARHMAWTLDLHPQTADYPFCNSSAYRKITVSLPGYGNMALDADALSVSPVLTIDAQMDISGILTYSIDYGGIHTYVATDLSVEAGFTVSKASLGTAVSAGAGALMSAVTLNIPGMINSVIGATKAAQPCIERANSGGGRSVLAGGGLVKVTYMDYEIVPIDYTKIGAPLCMTASPATYPGYLKCVNASVSCTGSQAEISEIVTYMNSGFYYE